MQNNQKMFGEEILTFIDVVDFQSLKLEEDQPSTKIQIMKAGKFDHPYGPFEITDRDLQMFELNFKNNVRRVDLAVDYSHDAGAKAAGWFKDVVAEGDKLYAEIEWTPEGFRSIKEKEFRFFSPEFTFLHVDAETGEKAVNVLLGGGLTNRPFLKEMEPIISLSEQRKSKYERPKKMDTISLQAHEAEVKVLNSRIKELEETAESAKKFADEVKTLKSEISKLHAENEKQQKDNEFNKMLSEGKVCEAQRKAFIEGNMAEFVRLHQPVNLGQGLGHSTQKDGGKTLTAEEEVDQKAEKLSQEKGISYSEAIKEVFRSDKELARRYNEEVEL